MGGARAKKVLDKPIEMWYTNNTERKCIQYERKVGKGF